MRSRKRESVDFAPRGMAQQPVQRSLGEATHGVMAGAGVMPGSGRNLEKQFAFQRMADGSRVVQRLLRVQGKQLAHPTSWAWASVMQGKQASHPAAGAVIQGSASGAVIQGKWFRMSSILSEQDERDVFEIQRFVDAGDYLAAFERLMDSLGIYDSDFVDLMELCKIQENVRREVEDVLVDTFEEPGKAFTASEVREHFWENRIIVGTLIDYQNWKRKEDQKKEDVMVDDRMEALIEQFKGLSISIPFRSDVDGRSEEHKVYNDEDEVIVESNPQPLKEVVTNASWEGQAITGKTLKQLGKLQEAAEDALYRIAGNKAKGYKGSRTIGKMKVLRKSLEDIAKLLSTLSSKLPMDVPDTDLTGSTNHGSNTNGVEGKKVVAKPLTINSNTAGSKPTDGRLMRAIRKSAGSESKGYKQMHLLNDLVFGPGQLWNLTPGPGKSNSEMESNVEHYLKRAVLGKGLVINFEATVNYANDPCSAKDTQIEQNPDRYRFQSISFSAEQLTFDTKKRDWVRKKKQDKDVAAIDGKTINWNYGKLTPLTSKPSIVDPKTSANDLETYGIPATEAARIVAFIQAMDKNGTPYDPGSVGKKEALAKAVEKYDGIKGFDTGWNATKVFWTIK